MNEHFYKSLKIENFRGIKSLEINDLARVNLFVGKNNYCKTSVLESVFLLTGISNPGLMIDIESWRGIFPNESSDLRNYFYARNHEQGITLSGIQRKGKRCLKVSPMFGNLFTERSVDRPSAVSGDISVRQVSQTRAENFEPGESLTGFKYKFTITDKATDQDMDYEATTRRTQLDDLSFTLTPADNYKETIKVRFLWLKGYDQNFVDKILNEKRKDSLLHSLRFIDPKIQDIKTGPRGVVSIDIGLDSFIPINLFGDGTVRILNILSSIDGTRDGVLLIDEVDNGLHVSTIKHMWEMILEHSAMCGTQIFATTHNADVIRLLTEVLSSNSSANDGDNIAACFALEKLDSDEVKVFRYSHEDLVKSENSGIDIR